MFKSFRSTQATAHQKLDFIEEILDEQDNHEIEGNSKFMTMNKTKIEENIDMKIHSQCNQCDDKCKFENDLHWHVETLHKSYIEIEPKVCSDQEENDNMAGRQ